ncbi:hypothetical protein [Paraburkholderia aspalathi]|uniref:hypothetical protein n=1 Tax=Paraburkholderia aspalathi TaxID=1324617 RepID=UPI0038BBD4BC
MSTLCIWRLPVFRFGNVVFAVFIGSVLIWSCSARSQESKLNSWEGEWFGVSSEGNRFGITLKNCETDEATTKCDAEVFGLGFLGKFCLSTGAALGTAGREELVISTGDRGPMNIKKKGSTIISSEIIRPSCEISRGATDISYMLQSRQVYLKIPGIVSGECNQDTSPAMHEVCTDPKVLSIIERAEKLPFPSESVNGFWVHDFRVLAKCNQAASPQDCVLEAYQHKFEELEANSDHMGAYGLPGDTLKAQELLGTVSGVYKRKFKNGDTSGDTYQSEDIFEFVPVSPFAAYFKLHLEFYNGHECNVAGITEYKAVDAFVFQDPEGPNGNRCLLSIKLDGNTVSFNDPNGNCMKFCGARGGFGREGFDLSQRRKIRYMPVIEKSADYINAMRDYEKRHEKSQAPK